MEILTQKPEETFDLGEKTGNYLIKAEQGRAARILALTGELGSGKTTFVQGLAKALGVPHRILSPTFLIVRQYELNLRKLKNFYHIDLYRVEKEAELKTLGFTEIFADRFAIVAIEWPEKLGVALPKSRINFSFKKAAGDLDRLIEIAPDIEELKN